MDVTVVFDGGVIGVAEVFVVEEERLLSAGRCSFNHVQKFCGRSLLIENVPTQCLPIIGPHQHIETSHSHS